MEDKIGVTKWPVHVSPLNGTAQIRFFNHLDVMERELAHLQTAITDVKNGARHSNNRLLASGLMNLRNWALSIAMSHGYV